MMLLCLTSNNNNNSSNMFIINSIIVLISFLTTSTFVCGQIGSVPSPDGTFHVVPRTSFSCKDRGSGYYADLETGCQIYHMCDSLGRQFSYSCPNTTLFQQRMLICDHWYMVNCSRSENDYDANLLIGQKDKHFVEDGEYDVRTPRPDLLEQHYSAAYNTKNFKVHAAVQNAIAGIHYHKEPSQKTKQFVTKDQQSLDSTTTKNVDSQFTVPGQYSINFIRNLAGGSTTPIPSSQKPFAQPLQQKRQPDVKVNDRRNIRNEGNFGINDQNFGKDETKFSSQIQTKSNVPISNLGNVKKPSIYFEPPLFSGSNFPQTSPKFTAPSTTTTIATTKAPTTIYSTTRFTTQTTTTTLKPTTTQYTLPQINQKPKANIPVPSFDIEPPLRTIIKPSTNYELPPFEYPAYTIYNEATDSPLKISLTTQKLGSTKQAPGAFTTTQAPKFQPIATANRKPLTMHQGSGFTSSSVQSEKILLPTSRILSRPTNNVIDSKPIKSNEIRKPWNDLLPPLEQHFKMYDDATTQGPPIYYEWKWAVPAFELEPPKNEDDELTEGISSTLNGKSFHKLTPNPFGNTDSADIPQSRGPTARSIPIDANTTTKRITSATGRPKTTTIHLNDIKKLQEQFSIPDYEFPLENDNEPSSFEQSESVNSFQVKIPDDKKSSDPPFYGENSKCPDCHPSFVVPGTCKPCIRIR